jgi:hypothetical protein
VQREEEVMISIRRTIRDSLLLAGLLVAVIAAGHAYAMDVFQDFFMEEALEASFSRDLRGLSLGGYRVGAAGPDPGISYNHLGAASDLWNNEHNQVLGGMQFKRHVFDREVILPDGTTLPRRINAPSAAILYKHITRGDWAINQSLRYTRITAGGLSEGATNKIDLVGTAVTSPKPGYAWVFGYLWSQEGYLDVTGNRKLERPVPLIEFSNGSHEEYDFILGFPILAFNYYPHPDWTLGAHWTLGHYPAASASYRVTERNVVRLSYGGHSWAYPLSDDEKNISYTARLLALHWAHAHVLAGIPFQLNIVIGGEHDRKLGLLGSKNKIGMEDSALIGFNLAIPF